MHSNYNACFLGIQTILPGSTAQHVFVFVFARWKTRAFTTYKKRWAVEPGNEAVHTGPPDYNIITHWSPSDNVAPHVATEGVVCKE